MTITLRLEEDKDQSAVLSINRRAFGGDAEAKLISALHGGGFTRVSLVAECDSEVVGHILFSELAIHTKNSVVPALSLAPMAVMPEFQRQGIGSALVRRGLELCKEDGHRIVLVVGHRDFYPRFGFSRALALNLESPYSGDSFMVLELTPGALDGVIGRVVYPPPFQDL